MKFWGVSQKKMGSSAHKFHGVLGSRGGVAKMFENIFLENDGYSEQKTKMKNTKKNCKVRLINEFWVKPPRS